MTGTLAAIGQNRIHEYSVNGFQPVVVIITGTVGFVSAGFLCCISDKVAAQGLFDVPSGPYCSRGPKPKRKTMVYNNFGFIFVALPIGLIAYQSYYCNLRNVVTLLKKKNRSNEATNTSSQTVIKAASNHFIYRQVPQVKDETGSQIGGSLQHRVWVIN